MWDAIREFLGAVVSWFYSLIPNLGVAIILLTVAVGLVLFPLTLKQTRSMRAMQQLQPELKRLQKEHAGDKAAMQQATLALYKERGVNPAAGCLPLLLQMPVWFALFQVLQSFAASPAVLYDRVPAEKTVCAAWKPTNIADPGQTCYFVGFAAGDGEGTEAAVTAKVSGGGQSVERRDEVVVASGDLLPGVTVTVRPQTGVVAQEGGLVRFDVEVRNGGEEAVTLLALSDVSGEGPVDLLAGAADGASGENTCSAPSRDIASDGKFECSFDAQLAGGDDIARVRVSAEVQGASGATATREDAAQVDVSEGLPGVTVTVRPADMGAVPAEGRLVLFEVTVRNGGTEAVTLETLTSDVYGSLTSPAASPTRFLTMVKGDRLYNDMQAWLEAGRQPEDPAWRDFLWMNLSISPRQALNQGFVAFIPFVLLLLIVMGTAYWQQAQTTPKPTEGQPKQPGQAVLKFFPVLFGFISFTLPAGLAVYFAASSIFRIGQQSLIIRLGDRKAEQKPKSEAAEPVAEEPKPARAAEQPARPLAARPKGSTSTPAPAVRSPQGSQQRGKKRRRR